MSQSLAIKDVREPIGVAGEGRSDLTVYRLKCVPVTRQENGFTWAVSRRMVAWWYRPQAGEELGCTGGRKERGCGKSGEQDVALLQRQIKWKSTFLIQSRLLGAPTDPFSGVNLGNCLP